MAGQNKKLTEDDKKDVEESENLFTTFGTCNLCHYPKRAELDDALLEGRVLKTTIARELNMDVDGVIEHLENHIKKMVPKHKDKEELKAEWASDKYDLLFNNLASLSEKFNNINLRNSVGPAEINMLVKLAQEIRKTVTDMSNLKGEIEQEHHYTMIMFNNLQEIVLKDLCFECRERAIKKIERLRTHG